MSLRALACRVLLAFLLVFAQQEGMLHELSHAFDALAGASDQRTPQKEVCSQCVAFAGVQHAAGGALPVLAPAELRQQPAPAKPFISAPPAFTAAYLSRAPPSYS